MQIINHKLEELDQLPRRANITMKCDCCQGVFEKRAKYLISAIKYRQQDQFFCSNKCANEVQKIAIICHCANCGIEVLRRPGDLKKVNNVFCSRRCAAILNNKICPKVIAARQKHVQNLKDNAKPKKIKKERIPTIYHTLNCSHCKKEFVRSENDIKKSKHQRFFCSKSCRMKDQNLNNPFIKSYHRSHAEEVLSEIISKDFPDLEIVPNSRKILTCGLEIDIFIPSMNLAIELNGPVHYMPIYGDDRLKKVQDKDARKQIELQEMGTNLIVVDISRLQNKKNTEKFLLEYYANYIKPVLT